MAKDWTFEDNSNAFLKEFKETGIAFLEEAKDSLASATQRNTPVKSGDLKRSFGEDSFVDTNEMCAYIGSSLEYSIWVERGTGEYAINGDGRRCGWKTPYGFTYGMKPRLMLYQAYIQKKSKIAREAGKRFGELSQE